MSLPITLVYSKNYDIKLYGLEFLHPFDTRKYGKAWQVLGRRFNNQLNDLAISPPRAVNDEELLHVHTQEYLDALKDKRVVARALEVPLMMSLPYFLIDRIVLQPMRWATKGTIVAAEMALSSGVGVNMSGGYHHASEQRGEGFCLFSDVGVAVALLRKKRLLGLTDSVAIIDLDAHQGNGFERVFMQDTSVHIFDMYNGYIYPNDGYAKSGIQADIPLPMGCEDNVYLNTLKAKLPDFLDECNPVKLAFYNAGSDILSGDPLGGFNVSAQSVVARDVYVFNELIKRHIPFVMLLSGGYTKTSYEIIADSVTELINMRCKTR